MMRDKDLIFLIGAGCSDEAQIPTSQVMVQMLEKNLENKSEWKKFNSLYYYLKNTIIIGEKLNQIDRNFNIEKLVNLLSELGKDKQNALFPFTKGWSNLLIEFTQGNFKIIDAFADKINEYLPKWVIPPDKYNNSRYYEHFFEFQRDWKYPLRVFSLNYDRCFENNIPSDTKLELGFGNNERWSDDNFYLQHDDVNIYLYKLHGSIDWYREEDNTVRLGRPGLEDRHEVIFGTDIKLQSIDPYLFCVHEFRKYSLECKVMIVIGYGFADDYINNLLKQALHHAEVNSLPRNVLYVNPNDEEETNMFVKSKLDLKNSQKIRIQKSTASEFLRNVLNPSYITNFIPKDVDDLF